VYIELNHKTIDLKFIKIIKLTRCAIKMPTHILNGLTVYYFPYITDYQQYAQYLLL